MKAIVAGCVLSRLCLAATFTRPCCHFTANCVSDTRGGTEFPCASRPFVIIAGRGALRNPSGFRCRTISSAATLLYRPPKSPRRWPRQPDPSRHRVINWFRAGSIPPIEPSLLRCPGTAATEAAQDPKLFRRTSVPTQQLSWVSDVCLDPRLTLLFSWFLCRWLAFRWLLSSFSAVVMGETVSRCGRGGEGVRRRLCPAWAESSWKGVETNRIPGNKAREKCARHRSWEILVLHISGEYPCVSIRWDTRPFFYGVVPSQYVSVSVSEPGGNRSNGIHRFS